MKKGNVKMSGTCSCKLCRITRYIATIPSFVAMAIANCFGGLTFAAVKT